MKSFFLYSYKGTVGSKTLPDDLVEAIKNNSIRETTMPPHVVRSSTRRHEFNVPQWTFHRAIKKAQLWAYKMRKVQRLAPGHDIQRIIMCNYLRQRSNNWFFWLISFFCFQMDQRDFLSFTAYWEVSLTNYGPRSLAWLCCVLFL